MPITLCGIHKICVIQNKINIYLRSVSIILKRDLGSKRSQIGKLIMAVHPGNILDHIFIHMSIEIQAEIKQNGVKLDIEDLT